MEQAKEIKIKIVNLDDLWGVDRVASELGVTTAVARALMKKALPSIKVNGFYTLKPFVMEHKERFERNKIR